MVTITGKRKQGKLNEAVFLEAIGQGMTKAQAGRKAGLEAKSDKHIINTVNKKIGNSEVLKKSILQRYEELEAKMMAEVEKKDLTGSAVNQLVVGMAVLRDKIQLLKGDPTSRVEVSPRMFYDGEFIEFKTPTQIEQGQAQNKELASDNIDKET